jgi:hypothetical protein
MRRRRERRRAFFFAAVHRSREEQKVSWPATESIESCFFERTLAVNWNLPFFFRHARTESSHQTSSHPLSFVYLYSCSHLLCGTIVPPASWNGRVEQPAQPLKNQSVLLLLVVFTRRRTRISLVSMPSFIFYRDVLNQSS